MRGYPKYKLSQVDLLDEVPSNWEVRRLASFGRFSKGGGISKSDLVENGIPAILYGDIYTKYNLKAEKIFNFISQDLAANSKLISKGDLLFTGSGETREDIGKCIVYSGISEVYAGGDTIIFSQKTNDSLFLAYSLGSNYAITKKAMNSRGDIIIHIYSSSLRDIYLPIPSLSEQKQIADFLDYKTEQCDRFIANRQKQIELLNEQKQYTLNKIVTEGIYPEQKFQEIENTYIKKIPVNWEFKKLAFISKITRLAGYEYTNLWKTKEDGEIIALRGQNVGFNELRNIENAEKISEELSIKLIRSKLSKGDIVFPCVGTVGKAVLIEEDNKYHINQNIAKITPSIAVDGLFLTFLLNSFYTYHQIIHFNTSDAQPNVLVRDLRRFMIPTPPLEEQREIANVIIDEFNKLDNLISKYQKQIDLMQEYRTVLISQAVTGKIDVREWKPKTKEKTS